MFLRPHSRKALSIIEVVVSLTILSVVLLTYGSTTQSKKVLIRDLTRQSLYQRLANVQLERTMNFVHSNRQEARNYHTTAKSDVATGSFGNFAEVFSFEGKSGNLDEFNGGNFPNIPLLQLQVRGTAYASNAYLNDVGAGERFLAFPYPKELRDTPVYNPSTLWPTISSNSGTLHHITPKLNEDDGGQRKYRSLLPLVSEEFTMIDAGGARYELGYQSSGVLAADDIQLAAGMQIFIDPGVIGKWENERVRRYVYYRKVREGNIVFRNNVKGRNDSNTEDGHITTDIDNLYIQSLNDWTGANNSSNGGEVTGVRGTAYPTTVGAVGAHSIYIMVVVRAIEQEDVAIGMTSMDDSEFLRESDIKAVAVGIAAPTYGKNLLKTLDLTYHRYSWSRIPGTKWWRQ